MEDEKKKFSDELKKNKTDEIVESVIREIEILENRMERKIKDTEEKIKAQEDELKSDIEELLEAEGLLPKEEQLFNDLISEISLILKDKKINIEEKDLIEVIKATIEVYEKIRERKVECANILKATMKYVVAKLRGYRVSVKFEPTKYPMQLIIQVFY